MIWEEFEGESMDFWPQYDPEYLKQVFGIQDDIPFQIPWTDPICKAVAAENPNLNWLHVLAVADARKRHAQY